MKIMNRGLVMALALLIASPVMADESESRPEAKQEQPPTEPKHTVGRSQAVEALRQFQQDPLHSLEAASVFTTYVKEDGAVHVSMNEYLVPWMVNRSVPQRAKAILLSAFVAGNFQAQLDDQQKLDDSAAGLTYTVKVYELLKKEDPTLMVPELEKLKTAKEQGNLQSAIDEMLAKASPAYQQ